MSINTFKAFEKEDCCGCGICEALCHKKAINLMLNDEGFWYPTFDEQKCNSCGLCEKACFCNLREEELNNYNEATKYYAFSKDQESILKSSSGAIAYEMGKCAIENGLEVLGTLYDSDRHIALTRIASSINEIDAFRGSKYIQAYSAEAFYEALNSKTNYLIVGTPCQIYGLKKAANLLKQDHRFIFVDFVCHGVPSYYIWHKYIDDTIKKYKLKEIKSVQFRNKKFGWHELIIKIVSTNKTIYSKRRRKDSFYNVFDDGFIMCRSCYSCKINNGHGVSDIRIGDYWGNNFKYNITGVSRMIITSEKGKDFFEKIQDRFILGETPELSLPNNNQFFLSPCKDERIREIILSSLKMNKSLASTIKRYRRALPIKSRLIKYLKRLPLTLENVILTTYRYFVKRRSVS